MISASGDDIPHDVSSAVPQSVEHKGTAFAVLSQFGSLQQNSTVAAMRKFRVPTDVLEDFQRHRLKAPHFVSVSHGNPRVIIWLAGSGGCRILIHDTVALEDVPHIRVAHPKFPSHSRSAFSCPDQAYHFQFLFPS